MKQEQPKESKEAKRQRELARITNLDSLSDFAKGQTSQNMRLFGSGGGLSAFARK